MKFTTFRLDNHSNFSPGSVQFMKDPALVCLTVERAPSAILERLSVSSSSCWAFLNLARLRAAISSASSICFLYVLIFCCSLAASSVILSWFFLSSSIWKESSLILRSAFWWPFWFSPVLPCTLPSSISSSRMRLSSLAMAVLPPRLAASVASASLDSNSPSCTSIACFAFDCVFTWSCSARSSSARRAASTIAFFAFSSEFFAWWSMSSISACIVCTPASRLRFSAPALVLIVVISLTAALASFSSPSVCLLPLALEGVGAPVGKARPLGHLLPEAGGLLVGHLGLPQLGLVPLDALQSLVVGLVGVIESNLELVDVALELLLDPQRLSLCLLLRLHGRRHGLHGTCVVLPGVVELFLLLSNPAVNLLLGLAKLKGGPQHLVLLGLEGALGLLEGGLELLLLGLQPPPLLVQLMNRSSAVSKLVKKILDLVSQVLVLTADDVQLLVGLVQRSLQAESLSGEVAALRVAGVQLGVQVVSLGLPLTNHLVEVLAPLLGDDRRSVGALVLHGHVLKLSLHPHL